MVQLITFCNNYTIILILIFTRTAAQYLTFNACMDSVFSSLCTIPSSMNLKLKL